MQQPPRGGPFAPRSEQARLSMKLLDYLTADTVLTNLKATDKKGLIDELSLPAAEIANIDHRTIANVLIEREMLGSTGIGDGIGIPHGKVAGLDRLIVGFGLSRHGVDFDTMDGKPAYLFFLLLSPDDSTGLHLMLLARISKLLKDPKFKKDLKAATDQDAVMRIIAEADSDS